MLVGLGNKKTYRLFFCGTRLRDYSSANPFKKSTEKALSFFQY